MADELATAPASILPEPHSSEMEIDKPEDTSTANDVAEQGIVPATDEGTSTSCRTRRYISYPFSRAFPDTVIFVSRVVRPIMTIHEFVSSSRRSLSLSALP